VVTLSNRLIAQVFDGTYDQAKAFAMWRFGLEIRLIGWEALSDRARAEACKTPVFSCLAQPRGSECGSAQMGKMAEAPCGI
jgi:hypothetical protein